MSPAQAIQESVNASDRAFRCESCGFALWTPVTALDSSGVGLYDDARFPGRLIVSASEHFEHLDVTPPEYLSAFMSDVQQVSRALRLLQGVDRVNVSILGNKDPHLHAHVIPRRLTDANVGKAPWDCAAPYERLDPLIRDGLVSELRLLLDGCS